MRRVEKKKGSVDSGAKLARPAALEKKKSTKLAAIRLAAREAFSEKGFDAATMQEIARRARVAIGTLFLYADNKRDIAFLAVLEDFDRAKAKGVALPTESCLIEQYVGMFGEYYSLHHASPAMARIILSEFLFFNIGKHAREHADRVVLLKQELARRGGIAHARGELRADAVPEEVADLAYFIFQGAVRQWVREGAADLPQGLSALRHMMTLALKGVAAPPDTRRRHRVPGATASVRSTSNP